MVSDRPLKPDLALAYLAELSTDIRAAAVLDESGVVAAQSGFDEDGADQVRELVGELFYHNYPGGTGLVSGAVLGKMAGDGAGQYVRGKN